MRARLRPTFLPPSDASSSSPHSPGESHDYPATSSSSLPPTLPPISRISPELNFSDTDLQRHVDAMSFQSDNRQSQSVQRSPQQNMESGFIGGVALQNYRRGLQAQSQSHSQVPTKSPSPVRHESSDGFTPRPQNSSSFARNRPVPAPINTNLTSRPPPQVVPHPYKSTPSFVAPTDLPNTSSAATGRRPAGTRLTTEPPSFASNPISAEPHKTKKSLPFLRNPMSSLLMRRKNSQNVPDPIPLPSKKDTEEPSYDPRIKGTRIHDFSAPRRREPITMGDGPPTGLTHQNSLSKEAETQSTQDLTEQHAREEEPPPPYPKDYAPALSSGNHFHPTSFAQRKYSVHAANEGNAVASQPSFTQKRRPVSSRLDSTSSMSSQTTKGSRMSETTMSSPPLPTDSTKTHSLRRVSLSSDISVKAIPRHMKSTSSRFSFDMIGAANEEKILEERHRQREAEKREAEKANPRDSVYDDFDDDFDYDAMMDDDGLEERIPGVNADYDDGDDYYLEEDIDPDDDQENFAGFSFQRSNVTTALPTPQSAFLLKTPRDADGNAIGFAETKDSPSLSEPSTMQRIDDSVVESQGNSHIPAGLGIQHVGLQEEPYADVHVELQEHQSSTTSRNRSGNEDLYFDDGMLGYEDEFAEDLASIPDGEPFDESIFDNNDTDKFGRPIAGAFAQAQAQIQTENQDPVANRESDLTSRGSDQTEAIQSTAHTSVSMGHHALARDTSVSESFQGAMGDSESHDTEQGSTLAYQAALAAAAHEAAASGKFQWNAGGQDHAGDSPINDRSHGNVGFEEDDGFSYENMDEFELDDDAIIAEANASALANDSDGWYGQEFGFYSTPINQTHASRGDNASTDDEPNYQYVAGGFFGPKGMDGLNRTKSGRVVSREPNLTPITERSEYSNRNSLMSLAVPGHGFGTPIQSPGLAQLAMMADHGADDMSLSALLRLRSKAWGTSQVSLGSSKEGSPRSDRGDLPNSPWTGGHGNSPFTQGWHGRSASSVSNVNSDLEIPITGEYPPPPHGLSSSAPTADRSGISRSTTGDSWAPSSTGGKANRFSLSAVGAMHTEWTRDQEISGGPDRITHRRQTSGDSIAQARHEGF